MKTDIENFHWADSPDCMYILDAAQRRSIALNRPVWKYLGYKREEIEYPEAAVPQSLLHHEDAVLVNDLFSHLSEMAPQGVYRKHLRFRDNKGRWLTFCLRIMALGDQTERFLGVLTDITPEKGSFHRVKNKLAALREQHERLDRLLAEISHDIRVPLQTIQLLAERMNFVELDSCTKSHVENISATAKHLNTTLTSILATGREAQGFAANEPAGTNIRSFLNRFLPKRLGVSIASGQGRAKAILKASQPPNPTEQGIIDLAAKNLVVNRNGMTSSGDLQVTLPVKATSLKGGKLDISGATLVLDDVKTVLPEGKANANQVGDWQARVELSNAALTILAPRSFTGEILAEGTDLSPFLTAFVEIRQFPDWLGRVVRFEDFKLESTVSANEERLTITDTVATSAGNASAKIWFQDQDNDVRQGKMLVQYHRFRAGIELKDKTIELELLNLDHWFATGAPK